MSGFIWQPKKTELILPYYLVIKRELEHQFFNCTSNKEKTRGLIKIFQNFDFTEFIEEPERKDLVKGIHLDYRVGLDWFFKLEFDKNHKLPYSFKIQSDHRSKGEVFRALFKLIEGIFSRTSLSHYQEREELGLLWKDTITCFFGSVADLICLDIRHTYGFPIVEIIYKNKSRQVKVKDSLSASDLAYITKLKRLENPLPNIPILKHVPIWLYSQQTISRVYDLGVEISEKVPSFKRDYWQPYPVALKAELEFRRENFEIGTLDNGHLKILKRKPRSKPKGFI